MHDHDPHDDDSGIRAALAADAAREAAGLVDDDDEGSDDTVMDDVPVTAPPPRRKKPRPRAPEPEPEPEGALVPVRRKRRREEAPQRVVAREVVYEDELDDEPVESEEVRPRERVVVVRERERERPQRRRRREEAEEAHVLVMDERRGDPWLEEPPEAPVRRARPATVVAQPQAGRWPLWGRFARRLSMVLLRPATFWERVRDEEIPVKELMWPHVVVLVGVRALAGFIGGLLHGASFGSSLLSGLSSFVSWLALIWVFAVVVGSVATARGARINAQDPLRFAAYGLAPLFMVGVLAAVPLPYVTPIAELIAMPYTFHVMGLGVVPLLGVPWKRAPAMVGLVCGVLLILWAVMPTLVPLVVEALTR